MTKAKVQSILKQMNESNRKLNKIANEVEKLEKKAKVEEKALRALKAKADRETKKKDKTGGCGCGCNGY